jgi:hypothetical protein
VSQRVSGYARVANDRYETPEWVTRALIPHIPSSILTIFDPACASGKILKTIAAVGKANCIGRDLSDGYDFLVDNTYREAIVTNPPYAQAEYFIAKAIANASYVAMLLRTDYDHAKTRQYLFKEHPWFAKKIALTKRIVWFERKGAAPSFNHSWFVWNKHHYGPPTLCYAP